MILCIFSASENASENASSLSAVGMTSSLSSDDPALSMVLEKAQVLLSGTDCSDLSLLLDEYKTRAIGVDQLAEDLVRMIDDDETKV
jgi:hypothetical protein